ncbi:mambrane protein [marine actinobacterium PHSC20C1]|nr:mambrane protein [marine actinobacterium PHSC20C1]
MSTDNDPGHGNSPAAWTAVVIMLVAFTIGTLAFWFVIPWLVFASAGLVIVGLIVGLVLRKLGYGVGGDKLTVEPHN